MQSMDTRLRNARERAGLTQEQLADKAGISRQALGALERGAAPMWRTAKLLAEVLGIEPEELFPLPERAAS